MLCPSLLKIVSRTDFSLATAVHCLPGEYNGIDDSIQKLIIASIQYFYSNFSKHLFSGPMLSIGQFVPPCVCLSVSSFFEVSFKRLFAPTS